LRAKGSIRESVGFYETGQAWGKAWSTKGNLKDMKGKESWEKKEGMHKGTDLSPYKCQAVDEVISEEHVR